MKYCHTGDGNSLLTDCQPWFLNSICNCFTQVLWFCCYCYFILLFFSIGNLILKLLLS